MKIAIIDNYDSFTYNLVHLVEELGAEVAVMRNDQFQLPDLAPFDKILLSPGPGIPSEADLLPGVIREYAARKSILGVCLGHQAIAEAFGARLENLSDVFHGIATPCRVLQADRLYSGLPGEFVVGRYHSWVVSHDAFPPPVCRLRRRATTARLCLSATGSMTCAAYSIIPKAFSRPWGKT